MNPEELKNAVEHIQEQIDSCDYGFSKADEECLKILLDLAESVLAVGAKMPHKILSHECFGEDCNCTAEEKLESAVNETIDACTLAFASMLDREKLYAILGKSIEFDEDGNAWTNHTKAVDAILSAMKGGVK